MSFHGVRQGFDQNMTGFKGKGPSCFHLFAQDGALGANSRARLEVMRTVRQRADPGARIGPRSLTYPGGTCTVDLQSIL
jgi:hypothetical protein